MNPMDGLITLALMGIFAGYMARLLVPGPDPLGFFSTFLMGIAGSFLGGFLGWAMFGADGDEGPLQPAGVIGSVIGAIILLLIYNSFYANRGSRA
jgi:uncharacterized membrane protein YeaQ/YmgE (transglycosylase-associated protein family)